MSDKQDIKRLAFDLKNENNIENKNDIVESIIVAYKNLDTFSIPEDILDTLEGIKRWYRRNNSPYYLNGHYEHLFENYEKL